MTTGAGPSYEPNILLAGMKEPPHFPNLFSTIKLGDFTLKNRIAFAPTGRQDCSEDGTPSDQNICGYTAIARGGVGMAVVEYTESTYKYGRPPMRRPSFHSDDQILKWKQLADATHGYGTVAVVQLGVGLGAMARFRGPGEVVAPSPIPVTIPPGSAPRGLKALEGYRGPIPRELSSAEIAELQGAFVAAARRVKRAGFDGVEIHATECLIGQFISPASNQRRDQYGGSTENRMRFLLELIGRTRKSVGNKEFLVGLRICADEHGEGGRAIEETKRMMPLLVEAGLDYVHVSSGAFAALAWTLPSKDGMLVEESAQIRDACSVPVICPNIHLPGTGERALESGKADMISLSRGLIADPDWPNKAREGRVKGIVKCTFCNSCFTYVQRGLGLRCPENPRVGWERFIPEYWPRPVRIRPVSD